MDVIKAECEKKNARLVIAKEARAVKENTFDYDDMENIEISLDGTFQIQNAALALEVCTQMGISEDEIRRGLNNAVWRGRFETINQNPLFVIDGAHNVAAAEELQKSIKQKFDGKKINYIMGVFADKEYEAIVKIMAPQANRIFAVTAKGERALKSDELAKTIKKYNKNTEAQSIEYAVRQCLNDKESVTVAFGSLSYLKDIIRVVEDEKMR